MTATADAPSTTSTTTVTDGTAPHADRDSRVKVKALLEQEGRDDLRLRIAVQPGGCSGLRYQLFFDERSLDGDVDIDFDGVEVVVDRMCAPYLAGATIDFADPIEQQGFTIDNPNAGGSAPAATRSAANRSDGSAGPCLRVRTVAAGHLVSASVVGIGRLR